MTQDNRFTNNIPTITAGAYSINDAIGGLQSIVVPRYSNILRDLIIIDANDTKAAMDVYLFNAAPTTILDNITITTWDEDDYAEMVDRISVAAGDYKTVGSVAHAIKRSVNASIASNSTTLYVYAVATGTPTYGAVDDLTFRFVVWPD